MKIKKSQLRKMIRRAILAEQQVAGPLDHVVGPEAGGSYSRIEANTANLRQRQREAEKRKERKTLKDTIADIGDDVGSIVKDIMFAPFAFQVAKTEAAFGMLAMLEAETEEEYDKAKAQATTAAKTAGIELAIANIPWSLGSKAVKAFQKPTKALVQKLDTAVEKAKKPREFIAKQDRGRAKDLPQKSIGRTATPWAGEKLSLANLTTAHDEAEHIINSRLALKKSGLQDHYVSVSAKGRSNIDGKQGYIMDKIPGVGLDEKIAAGSLSPEEGRIIYDQLNQVIDVLHKNKLPHGDLHARNIMIKGEGDNIMAVLIDPAPSRPATAATVKSPSLEKAKASDKNKLSKIKDELLGVK